VRNQSLAEATLPPGGETLEHYHRQAEEIYYFVSGAGRMRLGAEESDVEAGDAVVIPPGTPHKLWNPGPDPLTLLCCCAPAYADADTVMTEQRR
jgi:mannose-6-phosphate isomerase-like protein (cupin superfamily)